MTKTYAQRKEIMEKILDFASNNCKGDKYAFAFGYLFASLTDAELDELSMYVDMEL